MKCISTSEASLLGSPLFPQSADVVFNEKLDSMNNLVDLLSDLDSHYGFYILKNCFFIPKFLYILRTYPYYQLPHLLLKFDDLQRRSLETIINVTLQPESCNQAFLPVKFGGLGMRRATDLSLPAFISSSIGVAKTVSDVFPAFSTDCDLHHALSVWESKCTTSSTPSHEHAAIQKVWDLPIVKSQYAAIMDSVTDAKTKARLLSVSSKGSSAWLNAIPLPNLGLKLSNEQLRISIALRLGADVCLPYSCKCGAQVDSSGVHGLSCRFNKGRTARHAEANDIIRRALVSAGLPAVLEPQGLCRADGKRPDGATLGPWSKGKQLVWDFTCVDTLALSNLPTSSQGAGKLASTAEHKKRTKYEDLLHAYAFCPIAVETFGAWGFEAQSFIETVGRKIADATGEGRATLFLRQRISMAVQRGNAVSVISCFPELSNLGELDFL